MISNIDQLKPGNDEIAIKFPQPGTYSDWVTVGNDKVVAGGVRGLADRAPMVPAGPSSVSPEDDLQPPGAISAPS